MMSLKPTARTSRLLAFSFRSGSSRFTLIVAMIQLLPLLLSLLSDADRSSEFVLVAAFPIQRMGPSTTGTLPTTTTTTTTTPLPGAFNNNNNAAAEAHGNGMRRNVRRYSSTIEDVVAIKYEKDVNSIDIDIDIDAVHVFFVFNGNHVFDRTAVPPDIPSHSVSVCFGGSIVVVVESTRQWCCCCCCCCCCCGESTRSRRSHPLDRKCRYKNEFGRSIRIGKQRKKQRQKLYHCHNESESGAAASKRKRQKPTSAGSRFEGHHYVYCQLTN
mmetsp:Transcript_14012/g.28492  ORF Transcript_14012/g.28492 Transcript_14012/m.28492 type:complete len:271 (+) Transcript_14012:45-857(+)